MSTQQDIYVVGSEIRPPRLNKENYVSWSSRLLRYAKSKPNGKLLMISIKNGPDVRRIIHEPDDSNSIPPVAESTHEQTGDELIDKEAKKMEADDQAIQTILMGLPNDIYDAIDRNQNRYNAIQNVRNQNANQNRNGNGVAARAKGDANRNNRNQIRCSCRGIAVARDIDDIEDINANCVLVANLQQASTLGIQIGKASVYDSYGISDVPDSYNCYDNEIFNMFTQEEQYTKQLDPISEPHPV
nr:hypothetical protein [Tanacetum cinerariifolium]